MPKKNEIYPKLEAAKGFVGGAVAGVVAGGAVGFGTGLALASIGIGWPYLMIWGGAEIGAKIGGATGSLAGSGIKYLESKDNIEVELIGE